MDDFSEMNFSEMVRQIIREELSSFLGTSQYQFQKDTKFYDGRNIQTGYTIGTMIGTENTQKLGFFGKTPIVQPDAPTATASGIISALESLGIFK